PPPGRSSSPPLISYRRPDRSGPPSCKKYSPQTLSRSPRPPVSSVKIAPEPPEVQRASSPWFSHGGQNRLRETAQATPCPRTNGRGRESTCGPSNLRWPQI